MRWLDHWAAAFAGFVAGSSCLQEALAHTLTSVLNHVCVLSGLNGGPHPLPPLTM